MITVPDFIDYPKILKVSDYSSVFSGVYSYIIKPYANHGISLYVGFREDNVIVRYADWNSNVINLENNRSIIPNILLYDINKIVTFIKAIGVSDVIMYFSTSDDGPTLVDVRISGNKMMGPGMLRDVFGKMFVTQEVKDIAVLDEPCLLANSGMIVKPSRFRTIIDNGETMPLYGVIC